MELLPQKEIQKFEYCLLSFHVMASRFLISLEDEIRQLLEEKDSENTSNRKPKTNIQSRSTSFL